MDDIYTNQEVESVAKFIFTFQVFATTRALNRQDIKIYLVLAMSLQKGTPAKISQTGVQSTPSSVKERKLESNIFGSTANNNVRSRYQKMQDQDKGRKREGGILETWKSKH
ncbi:hypothetical protein R3W88_021890 [Solanum pinnatisectum]|uniref:Uncharacterized protein n=1 Tax=Solanum pinnatisectum TaxID=50273 RepID=A0AAV9LT45_9SOLN|nr:hypothetical protein R3W88_021890 [Solanum pinnatisectum]